MAGNGDGAMLRVEGSSYVDLLELLAIDSTVSLADLALTSVSCGKRRAKDGSERGKRTLTGSVRRSPASPVPFASSSPSSP